MFSIPKLGSPRWALIVWSLVLGLLGWGFALFGVFALWQHERDPVYNVFMLGVGLLLILTSAIMMHSGLTESESPQSLFISGVTAFEPGTRQKNKIERELADKYFEETCQNANKLTPEEQRELDNIKRSALNVLTHHEVVQLLSAKDNGAIVLANSLLQPVAFAMRPTTKSKYIKGVVLEVLTWSTAIIGGALIIIFSPVFLLLYIWGNFKTLLHHVLRWSRRARQYRIRPHNVFLRDNRTPILYLRSFLDESNENAESFLPTTSEEKLVSSYNRSGPVIALGKPGEELPLLGASRIYFDNSTWQAAVLYLLSVSQLVIIQAGIAPGLLWELSVIRRKLAPEKLVISFTGWQDLDEWTRHLHYLRFKKYAEELLEHQLPPNINNTSHLTFDADWEVKPQSDFSYSLPSVRARRRKIFRFVGAVSTVAVGLIAVSFWPAFQRNLLDLTAWTTYREDSRQWNKYSPDSALMTVYLPASPTPVQAIDGYRLFDSAKKDLRASMCWFSQTSGPVNAQDLKELAVVFHIRADNEVSDFTYTSHEINQKQLALDGKYTKDGKQYQIRCQSWTNNPDAWFVCVSYSPGNNDADAAAKRILRSVTTGVSD
ncbi:MAG TPA: hypothetical protein VJ875_10230 [Pyrinomonadaceae bacterium]|nr:hypothetical protein [Pyrinomonadaceae bacterium]